MEKIKDYRIHTNIHGGGWKDKYDLRDKIRRLMLRLRANSASQDVINASREMNDLIQEMKESIKFSDTLISKYEIEKEIQNKKIIEKKTKLSKAIKEHGFMKNKQQKRIENTLERTIHYHEKIHDEMKTNRDSEYTKKKELKNHLVELEKIARKRDRMTETQSRLHDEAYAYAYPEGEVMSVHPLNPKERLESASESIFQLYNNYRNNGEQPNQDVSIYSLHSYPDVELQRLEDIIGTLQSEIQNYELIIAHEADQDRVDDATERRNQAREEISRLNREKVKYQGSGKPKRQLKGYKINI